MVFCGATASRRLVLAVSRRQDSDGNQLESGEHTAVAGSNPNWSSSDSQHTSSLSDFPGNSTWHQALMPIPKV